MFKHLKMLFPIEGVFWIVLVCAPATGAAQLVNVARGKPVHQSSTSSNGYAERAVDGNRNQNYGAHSCSHTGDELHPYWEVDLGDVYGINNTKIYNRLDCCASRTRDVHTTVSMDSNVYKTVCIHDGQIPGIYTCVPETKTIGRWVRVTIMAPDLNVLSMCEMEVMSDQLAGRLKSVPSVRGTGTIFDRYPVKSNIECASICSRTDNCRSVNVITSTARMECELLDSATNTATVEENVSFWTTYLN